MSIRWQNDNRPGLTSRRLTAVLAILAAAVALVVTGGNAQAAPAGQAPASGPSASTDKGPVGWDTYRQLDRLPELTHGVQTKQFSSFDRSGGNGDFNRCLRQTAGGGCVLAEHSGPGEIDSIWGTNFYQGQSGREDGAGNLHVVLDGRTVVDAPWQQIVDGKLGAPFVYPLVANADQSSGGVDIFVPMPFRTSMLVYTDQNPDYYHVTYRDFADATGVTTFDPSDKALDVIAKLKAAGTADPKPAEPGARTDARTFSLAPGQSTDLADLNGPGSISQLKLQIPQLQAPPTPETVTDDGRAFGRDSSAYDQFTVKIDPNNQGVRLTRRLDAGIAGQVADVYVDGQKVAQWAANQPQAGCNWLDESVNLPASATAGKSAITVRDVFNSSSNDVNAFTYWADSIVNGSPVRTDTVDVGPSHTADEAAHNYSISNQTWSGERTYCYPPDTTNQGPVLASNDVLQNTRVRITFDGQRTVDAPLGQFFGSGLGLADVKDLMYGMDPASKTMTSWWPMPYRDRATVQLYNGSSHTIDLAKSSVTSAPDTSTVSALSRQGDFGYFRATANGGPTTPGEDYTFLHTGGWGKFVGVTESMVGPASRGYLEGDERVYVDGSRTPQIHGTGTEDFYEGGWYFDRGTFTDPVNGEPWHQGSGIAGCPDGSDCTGTYRSMIEDAVPFGSSLTFGIEHGGTDDVQADYSSTAYWYGRGDYTLQHSDSLDVGDAASEAAHGYQSSDAGPTQLTSTYEGNDGTPAPMTHAIRATSAPITFKLLLAKHNAGVLLRRTSDQANAYQQAAVAVDGTPAGTWLEPLGNSDHRWLDDTLWLPPALTSGKSVITVTLTPAAGAPAWTAARYSAQSVVAPFTDHKAPTAVTGLTATGGPDNVIHLAWQPAADQVGVDHYNVYASRTAGFRPGPATLAAQTSSTSFDDAVGLRQHWYYRVTAVDLADNQGAASDQADAVSGNTVKYEAESLLPAVSQTAPAVAQGNCCGVSWSGGAQLWFQAAKPGDTVTLAVDVPTTGSYRLAAAQTEAPDYGITTLAVDGTQVGGPFDAYNGSSVTVSDPQDYGTVQLAAGHHTITVTVTGHNAASSGYFAGLDYLTLQLAG